MPHDVTVPIAADRQRVLVLGATGAVGRHVLQALLARGLRVRAASRRSQIAERHADAPGALTWIRADAEDDRSLERACQDCDAAIYLLHGLGQKDPDYARWEERAAHRFVRAASKARVKRLVYVGGPRPRGTASRHLQSRLRTGQILREGPVPCAELRASLVVGPDSASFKILHDLSRSPVLALPPWVRTRLEPLWIKDLAYAVTLAVFTPDLPDIIDVPGPQRLSMERLLRVTAQVQGRALTSLHLPFAPPPWCAPFAARMTSVPTSLAHEIVLGLGSDLLSDGVGIWRFAPRYQRLAFRAAVERTIAEEH